MSSLGFVAGFEVNPGNPTGMILPRTLFDRPRFCFFPFTTDWWFRKGQTCKCKGSVIFTLFDPSEWIVYSSWLLFNIFKFLNLRKDRPGRLGATPVFRLERLSAACQRHNVWLVVDNTYEHFTYEEEHQGEMMVTCVPNMGSKKVKRKLHSKNYRSLWVLLGAKLH